MRTTLDIQDEVFRRAKSRAAEIGVTLGEFVSSALRDSLGRQETSSEVRFDVPVFGDPAMAVNRSATDLAALRDDGR